MSVRFVAALIAALVVGTQAYAQEMEPRAYSASPTGATFLGAALSRSAGSVVFDPTLPITDVEAGINGAAVAAGMTFGLLGKLALISAAVPYAWGDISGQVYEEAGSVTRSGLADTRIRLSINLRGNDAMRIAEFAKTPRRTIVGASLTVAAPTGEYDGTKLINLGNHRWAFKPEAGVAVPRGRWEIDAYAGVWLFTSNPDFFPGGQMRTQDPLFALQGHVSYTIRPRLWLAANATWYAGGKSQVAGGAPSATVNNSRLGVTASLPVGRQQSIKLSYGNGVIVRGGTNFRTFSVGWQWLTVRP
jgi:hypothetical protein